MKVNKESVAYKRGLEDYRLDIHSNTYEPGSQEWWDYVTATQVAQNPDFKWNKTVAALPFPKQGVSGITRDKAQALKDRLEVFADTPEIIDMLKYAADDADARKTGHGYACMEARVHIQGLYDLAKEMLKEIKRNVKE